MKQLRSLLYSFEHFLLHSLVRKHVISLNVCFFLVHAALSSSCPVGFMPPDCTQQCPDGFYGVNCLSPCSGSCANQSCQAHTGECYQCRVGFEGSKCSEKCSRGAYGQDCKMTCPVNCLDNACNPFTGYCNQCLDGFSGSTCEDIETEDDRIAQGRATKRVNKRKGVLTKPISGNTVLYVVIVAVTFSVPICAIACWWWFLKKKIKSFSTENQTQPIYRPGGMEAAQARKVSRSQKYKSDDASRNLHKNASDFGDGDIQSGTSHGKEKRYNRGYPTKTTTKLTNNDYYSGQDRSPMKRGATLERGSKMDRECRLGSEQISPDKDSTQNMEEMSKILEENRPFELQRAANYSQHLFFKTRPESIASETMYQGKRPLDKSLQSFVMQDVYGHIRSDSRMKNHPRRGFRNDNHIDDEDHVGSAQYSNQMRTQKDSLAVSGNYRGFASKIGMLWQKLKKVSTRKNEKTHVLKGNVSSKSLMVDLDKPSNGDMRLVTRDTMTSSDLGNWSEGPLMDVSKQSNALDIYLRDTREAVYNQTTEPLYRGKAGNMTKVQGMAKLLGLSDKLKFSLAKGQHLSPQSINETKLFGHDSRFSNYDSRDQTKSDPDKTPVIPSSSHLLRLINAKASEIFSRQIAGYSARRRHRPNDAIRREHSCPDVSIVSSEIIGSVNKPPNSVPRLPTQKYSRDNWSGKPNPGNGGPHSLIYNGTEMGPYQDTLTVMPQSNPRSVKYLENFDAVNRNKYSATTSEKPYSCYQDHEASVQRCAKIDFSCSRPGQTFPPQNYRLFPSSKYPPQGMNSSQHVAVPNTTELSSARGSHPSSSHCNTLLMSSFSGQVGISRDARQCTAPVWNHITLLNPAAAVDQRKPLEPRESSSCERSTSDHHDLSQSDCSHSYDVEKCEKPVKYSHNSAHSKPNNKVTGNRPVSNSPLSKVKAKYQIVNETAPSPRNKSPRYSERAGDVSDPAKIYAETQPSIYTNDKTLLSSSSQSPKTELNQRQDFDRSNFITDGDNLGEIIVHNSNQGELSSVCDKAIDTDICLQVNYYLKDLLQLSPRSAPCNSFNIPWDVSSRFPDVECSARAGDRIRYELGNILGSSRSQAYAENLRRYQSPRTFTTEIGTETSLQERELINKATGPDDEDAKKENEVKTRRGPTSFDISTQVYCTKLIKYSSKKKRGKLKDGHWHKPTKQGKQASGRKETKFSEPLTASKACYVRTTKANSPGGRRSHQATAEKQTTSKNSSKRKPKYHAASFSETTSSTGQQPSSETKHRDMAQTHHDSKTKQTTASPPKRSRTYEKSSNQSASNCLSALMSSNSEYGEGNDFKGNIKIHPIKIIRVRVEPETDRNMADFEHLEKVTYTEHVVGNSTNSSNELVSSESESSEFFSSWKTLSVKQKEKLVTAFFISPTKEPNHWPGKELHTNQIDGEASRKPTIINDTIQMGDTPQKYIHTEKVNPGKMTVYADETSVSHMSMTRSNIFQDFWNGRKPTTCTTYDSRAFWNQHNMRMDFQVKDLPKHRFYRSEPGRSAVASGRVTSPLTSATSNKCPTSSHMGRNLPMWSSSPPSGDSFAAPRSRFLSTRTSEPPAGSWMMSEYSRTPHSPISGSQSTMPRSSMFTRHANPEYSLTSSSFKDVYETKMLSTSGSILLDNQDTWGSLNEKNSPGSKKAKFWERKIETNKNITNFAPGSTPLFTNRDRVQLQSEDESSWSIASQLEREAKEVEYEQNDCHSDEESSDDSLSSRSKSTATDVKQTETATQKETHNYSIQPQVETKYRRFSYIVKPLPRGLVGASKCNKGNFSPQMDYRRGLNNFHYILKSPKSLKTPPESPNVAQGSWDAPMQNWKKVSNQVDYPVPSLLEDAVELTQGRKADEANIENNDRDETTDETRGTRTPRSPYSSEDFREQYSKLVQGGEYHNHEQAGSNYHETIEAEELEVGLSGSGMAKIVRESEVMTEGMNDVVRVIIDSETEFSARSKMKDSQNALTNHDYSYPAVGKLDHLYYARGKAGADGSVPDDTELAYRNKPRPKDDYHVIDKPEMAYSMTDRSHTGDPVSGREDNTFPLISRHDVAYNFPNKSEMSPPITSQHDELHRMTNELDGGYLMRREPVNNMPQKSETIYNTLTISETQYSMADKLNGPEFKTKQTNSANDVTNNPEAVYPSMYNAENAYRGMDNSHFYHPVNDEVRVAYSEHGTYYIERDKQYTGYPVEGDHYLSFNEQGAVYPDVGAHETPYPKVNEQGDVNLEAPYSRLNEQGAIHHVCANEISYPSISTQKNAYPVIRAHEASYPRVSEQSGAYPPVCTHGAPFPCFNEQGPVYPAEFKTGTSCSAQNKPDTFYLTMAEHESPSYPMQKPTYGYQMQKNIDHDSRMMPKTSDTPHPITDRNLAVHHLPTKARDAYISGGQKEGPNSLTSKRKSAAHTRSETREHYAMSEHETATHKLETDHHTINKHAGDNVLSLRDAAYPTSLISEPVYSMAPMPGAAYSKSQEPRASYPLSGKSKPAYAGEVKQENTNAGMDNTGAPVRRRHKTGVSRSLNSDLINSNSKGQFAPPQDSKDVDKPSACVPTLTFGVDKDTETASINFGVGNVTSDAVKHSLDSGVSKKCQDPNNIAIFSQEKGCQYTFPNTSSDNGKRSRSKHTPSTAKETKRDEEVTEFKSVIDEELFYDAMDAKEFVSLQNRKSLANRTLDRSEVNISKIIDSVHKKLRPTVKSSTTASSSVKTNERNEKKSKYTMRFAGSESGESTSVLKKSKGRRIASVFRLGRADDKKRLVATDKSTSVETRNPSESVVSSDSNQGPRQKMESPKKEKFFDTSQSVGHDGLRKSSLTEGKQKPVVTSNDGPERCEHVHFEHKKLNNFPSIKEIFYDAA